MTDVKLFTAIAIFTKPENLEFVLSEHRGKWGFTISQGPGRNGAILLQKNPVLGTSADAIQAINEILQTTSAVIMKGLEDPKSLITRALNETGSPIDEANALFEEYRERICGDLARSRTASPGTYKQQQTA